MIHHEQKQIASTASPRSGQGDTSRDRRADPQVVAQVAQLAAHSDQLRDHGATFPRCATDGLRAATVEDVRDALAKTMVGVDGKTVGDATARQYVLRIKSLLGYAHKLGY